MYKIVVELGQKTLHLETKVFDTLRKGEQAAYSDANKITLKGIVEDVQQINSDTFKVILSTIPD